MRGTRDRDPVWRPACPGDWKAQPRPSSEPEWPGSARRLATPSASSPPSSASASAWSPTTRAKGETDYPPAGVLPDLARVLGVTTDQLLGVKPVRSRTKKPQDTRLWRRFKRVEKLPAQERRQLLQLIDAFLEREKLRGNGAG